MKLAQNMWIKDLFLSVAEEELMSLDWNKINLIIIFQDWKDS